LDGAINSINLDFCPKSSVNHTNMFFGQNNVAFASKVFMSFDSDMNVQITTSTAADCFTAVFQPDCRAVINAGWDFDRQFLFATLGTFAVTDSTDFFRYLAAAFAGWTRRGLLDLTKHRVNNTRLLAATLTGRTGFHTMARFDCRAMTMATFVIHIECYFSFYTKDCFLKIKRHAGFDIAAATRSLRLLSATTKELAEYIAESAVSAKIKVNVLAVKALEWIATCPTAAAITTNTGMAELVVALAFLLVF
jgi:hypothetical protein